jgi:hypothetical protein
MRVRAGRHGGGEMVRPLALAVLALHEVHSVAITP